MDWSAYSRLTFDYPADGVLLIKINRPDRLNAMDEVLHTELSRVWLDVDKDDGCRAVVITGAGQAFSAGGDFEMVQLWVNLPARDKMAPPRYQGILNSEIDSHAACR